MILEAFSEYLKAADKKIPATDVLVRWLWERLSLPAETVVDRVLHHEIRLLLSKSNNTASRRSALTSIYAEQTYLKTSYVFKGSSESGVRLLSSLYEYCLSYEQQKWSRWVHSLKASDFNNYIA